MTTRPDLVGVQRCKDCGVSVTYDNYTGQWRSFIDVGSSTCNGGRNYHVVDVSGPVRCRDCGYHLVFDEPTGEWLAPRTGGMYRCERDGVARGTYHRPSTIKHAPEEYELPVTGVYADNSNQKAQTMTNPDSKWHPVITVTDRYQGELVTAVKITVDVGLNTNDSVVRAEGTAKVHPDDRSSTDTETGRRLALGRALRKAGNDLIKSANVQPPPPKHGSVMADVRVGRVAQQLDEIEDTIDRIVCGELPSAATSKIHHEMRVLKSAFELEPGLRRLVPRFKALTERMLEEVYKVNLEDLDPPAKRTLPDLADLDIYADKPPAKRKAPAKKAAAKRAPAKRKAPAKAPVKKSAAGRP